MTTASQEPIECILPNHSRTRTFSSLLDLQHNSKSFKVNGAGYEGNAIDFSFQSIDRIPRNAFITYTSQYIWTITLRNKQIKQIDDGAFVNLNCLHVLDLQNNSLSALSAGMFEKLGNLVTLRLNDNLIEELKNLVFRELVGLKYLDLGRNRIRVIGVEAFEGLKNLKNLHLGQNMLTCISPETFVPLGNLVFLELNSNRIQNLEPQLWRNLTKLTTLNLADNLLTSFDPIYNFSFVSLSTLNLSMNDLTKLNVHALKKHLPALATIDLNGNQWLCEDLAAIIPALRDSRISYVKTKNTAIRNEDGIPCNYNTKTYTEKTTTTATMNVPFNKTTMAALDFELGKQLRNATFEIQDVLEKTNDDLLSSMEKTQNLIVSLLVLVVIFIALELTFRTGLVNKVIRRQRSPYVLNDNNVDDIALLPT